MPRLMALLLRSPMTLFFPSSASSVPVIVACDSDPPKTCETVPRLDDEDPGEAGMLSKECADPCHEFCGLSLLSLEQGCLCGEWLMP